MSNSGNIYAKIKSVLESGSSKYLFLPKGPMEITLSRIEERIYDRS